MKKEKIEYSNDGKTLRCADNVEGHFCIPEGVTRIGDRAFAVCTKLTSVKIPHSVIEIGNGAFGGCTGLTSITVPNSVTVIGESAFENCTSLNSIELSSSLKRLSESTFRSCTNLTSVVIPDSVVRIGVRAFKGCKNLTDIRIGSSVIAISTEAFSGCTRLTSIEIPNSVTEIGVSAFENCNSLKSIKLSDSLSEIDMYVFQDCINLGDITIPKSVTEIDNSAFWGCPAKFTVIPGNDYFCSKDGSLLTADGKLLLRPYVNKDGCIVVPDTVETLGSTCFAEMKINKIIIPASVNRFEGYAFCETRVKEMHIRCEHPERLNIDRTAFCGNDYAHSEYLEDCTLYVPIGTGYAYRHHPAFFCFKEVVIEK